MIFRKYINNTTSLQTLSLLKFVTFFIFSIVLVKNGYTEFQSHFLRNSYRTYIVAVCDFLPVVILELHKHCAYFTLYNIVTLNPVSGCRKFRTNRNPDRLISCFWNSY